MDILYPSRDAILPQSSYIASRTSVSGLYADQLFPVL